MPNGRRQLGQQADFGERQILREHAASRRGHTSMALKGAAGSSGSSIIEQTFANKSSDEVKVGLFIK